MSLERTRRRSARNALVTVAITPVVLAGLAVPARADVIAPSTPGCLVGAALMLPMTIGMTLMFNPTSLSDVAGGYWLGGMADQHDASPFSSFLPAIPASGWLQKCGLNT